MTNLDKVKQILYEKDASLVVCYSNGEIKDYYQDRIKDIKDILLKNPNALKDAVIADKVIGKTAAALMISAGVKEIFAGILSEYAILILDENNVEYEFDEKVEYIINQDKTGMCPMENKFKEEMDIQKIYNEVMSKR